MVGLEDYILSEAGAVVVVVIIMRQVLVVTRHCRFAIGAMIARHDVITMSLNFPLFSSCHQSQICAEDARIIAWFLLVMIVTI